MLVQIKVKGTENDKRDRYIDQLRRELRTNENELQKFTSRSEELERGKRVQHIFGAAPNSIRKTIVNDLDIMEQRKNKSSALTPPAVLTFSSSLPPSSNFRQQQQQQQQQQKQQPTVVKVSVDENQLPRINSPPSSFASSFYTSGSWS